MAKFQPGQSGNPAGRPKRSDTEREQRERIRAALPGILDNIIEQAQEGDLTASRLLLERVMPALRPLDQPVVLPAADPSDITAVGRAALEGLATGELTPEQARAVMATVTAQARVIEVSELIERVERLEAPNGNRT